MKENGANVFLLKFFSGECTLHFFCHNILPSLQFISLNYGIILPHLTNLNNSLEID